MSHRHSQEPTTIWFSITDLLTSNKQEYNNPNVENHSIEEQWGSIKSFRLLFNHWRSPLVTSFNLCFPLIFLSFNSAWREIFWRGPCRSKKILMLSSLMHNTRKNSQFYNTTEVFCEAGTFTEQLFSNFHAVMLLVFNANLAKTSHGEVKSMFT